MKACRFSATWIAAVLLTGCGGGGYGGGGSSNGLYTIGGSVAGLAGTLVLQDNGVDNDTITTDGNFTFANSLPYLSAYNVTVLSQPANQSCTVSNGTGVVGLANVTNIVVECVFVPVPMDLVITEVMANPAGAEPTGEWFEVLNISPHTLHLDGMVVTAGANNFTVPAGISMPSGAYFVFAASSTPADNGGLPAVDVVTTGLTLANTSLTLTLSFGANMLDSVAFATSTDGVSWSLDPGKQDPISNDDVASNWCLSTSSYGDNTNKGTPGAAGASCP